MINYITLSNELERDPQEFGYHTMSVDEIVEALNKKQFFHTELIPGSDGAAGITILGAKQIQTIGLNIVQQVERSRAELLFGPDTIITSEDISLALNH